MPAAATNDMITKLRLPTLPKAWTKRLLSGSTPSPGRSNASGGASTIGTPLGDLGPGHDAQHVAMRHLRQGQVGDHESDDGGRHCQRQQRGDACATLDQVSERMPPAITMPAAQATTSGAIRRSDCPRSHAAA